MRGRRPGVGSILVSSSSPVLLAIAQSQPRSRRPIKQAQATAQTGGGFPGDGESEPAALADGPQRAIEGIEYPFALRGGDAGAVVEDVDDDAARIRGEAQRDLFT